LEATILHAELKGWVWSNLAKHGKTRLKKKNKHLDFSKLGHRAMVKGAFQPPSFPGSVPCPFCPPPRYLGAHELLHPLVKREGSGRKPFSHNETCVTPGIPIDFNGLGWSQYHSWNIHEYSPWFTEVVPMMIP
jgi:hypothetical protein